MRCAPAGGVTGRGRRARRRATVLARAGALAPLARPPPFPRQRRAGLGQPPPAPSAVEPHGAPPRPPARKPHPLARSRPRRRPMGAALESAAHWLGCLSLSSAAAINSSVSRGLPQSVLEPEWRVFFSAPRSVVCPLFRLCFWGFIVLEES